MGGEGGGLDHVPKVLRHFLPKYCEFWALKSYLTMSKMKGGGGGSRPLLNNVQKKDAIFLIENKI